MTSKVTLHLGEMRLLRTELAKAKNARVRVGILGSKADRFAITGAAAVKNNPTIGLEHEYGVMHNPWGCITPARSFLRMPLMTRLGLEIEKIGRSVFRAIVLKRGINVALQNLGAVGENVVQQAFATGGFGQWPALSAITIRKKGSSAILIESAQLRKSVTSQVVMGRP